MELEYHVNVKQDVGALLLRKTASHSTNKKLSQQCKQAWMRSAAQALCTCFKLTASVFHGYDRQQRVQKRNGTGSLVVKMLNEQQLVISPRW
jgi:hypothetical protein